MFYNPTHRFPLQILGKQSVPQSSSSHYPSANKVLAQISPSIPLASCALPCPSASSSPQHFHGLVTLYMLVHLLILLPWPSPLCLASTVTNVMVFITRDFTISCQALSYLGLCLR